MDDYLDTLMLAMVHPILESIAQGFDNKHIAEFFGYKKEEIELLSQEYLGFSGWEESPTFPSTLYTLYRENSPLTNLPKYDIIMKVCKRFEDIERRLGYVD